MDTLGLKNYRVIKKIGQGGMGVVYLAEDLALGRLVALKFLASYLVRDPEILKRFRAEARSQARLVHPHITLVYAFEEVGDQAFLVLEYVEGETLEHRIKEQGRIPTREAAAILSKVLSAMHYAHGKGVVHRDIKPANIGFTPEGTVKLMDFGIALNLAESNRLTRTGHILGTPHYMAPEQILGQPLDARTDIYALGITLFEMLSGKVPFEGDSDYAVSVAQINDPPPSLRSFGYDDITPSVEKVVFKALAKNPRERFHTAREFRQALEAAVASLAAPGAAIEPALDKSTLELKPPAKEAPLPPEPLDTSEPAPPVQKSPETKEPPPLVRESLATREPLPPPPKRGTWKWAGVLTAAGGVLTLGILVLLYGPLTRPGGFTGRTAAPSPSNQGQPSPPVAESAVKVKATPAPPPPSQPETTKVADLKGEKAVTQDPGATPPSPKEKEKAGPLALATATLVPPHKEPAIPKIKEKQPADYLEVIKTKLKEQGLGSIQVSLDEKEGLMVAGPVKTASQKNQVMSLVKSSGFPGPMDFGKLSLPKKVSEKPPGRKAVPETPRPSPPPVVAPMKPLGPKLD